MELNAEQKALLYILKRNRGCINRNTLKTIKGQVLKGDIDKKKIWHYNFCNRNRAEQAHELR